MAAVIEPCTVHFNPLNGTSPFGQSGILFKNSNLVLTSGFSIYTAVLDHNTNTPRNKGVASLKGLNLIQAKVSQVIIDNSGPQLIQKEFNVTKFITIAEVKRSLKSVLGGFDITKGSLTLKGDDLCAACASFVLLEEESATEDKANTDLDQFFRTTSHSLRKAESVYTVTTPFGNDAFFATHNDGIISNLINDSLMILSLPLVQGCEGAGVFSRNKLIGVVLGSSFNWKKSNVVLTLAVRFDVVLRAITNQREKFRSTDIASNFNNFKGERSVVLVDAGNSWGCGTLIKFRGKWAVITCAHVIEDANEHEIRVKWRSGTYKPRVIYKNPHSNKAYDIALLSAPLDASETDFVPLAKYKPVVGSRVYCVGFPLVPSLAQQNHFSPFIFDGIVTKYSPGMMYTDCIVQAGQSGGPIFDLDARLLGICVSNTKDEVKGHIFPSLNMAVPVRDIYRILEKYFETNGECAFHIFLW